MTSNERRHHISRHPKTVLSLVLLAITPFCLATSLDRYRWLSATGRYTLRYGYTGDLKLLAKTSPPAAPLGPSLTLPFGKAELPGIFRSAPSSTDELRFV